MLVVVLVLAVVPVRYGSFEGGDEDDCEDEKPGEGEAEDE
jgi:hypothetical protein